MWSRVTPPSRSTSTRTRRRRPAGCTSTASRSNPSAATTGVSARSTRSATADMVTSAHSVVCCRLCAVTAVVVRCHLIGPPWNAGPRAPLRIRPGDAPPPAAWRSRRSAAAVGQRLHATTAAGRPARRPRPRGARGRTGCRGRGFGVAGGLVSRGGRQQRVDPAEARTVISAHSPRLPQPSARRRQPLPSPSGSESYELVPTLSTGAGRGTARLCRRRPHPRAAQRLPRDQPAARLDRGVGRSTGRRDPAEQLMSDDLALWQQSPGHRARGDLGLRPGRCNPAAGGAGRCRPSRAPRPARPLRRRGGRAGRRAGGVSARVRRRGAAERSRRAQARGQPWSESCTVAYAALAGADDRSARLLAAQWLRESAIAIWSWDGELPALPGLE